MSNAPSPCDVVVIGSSNMDMVVRCAELPLPGQTVTGSDFVMNPGGKGANQAVAACKLGARTQLVARLGNDLFAQASRRSFEEVGLGTDYLVTDDHAASGVALIYVDENGENQIVVALGANALLTPEDVDHALPAIKEAKVMILQLEIPMETVRHAAQLAADNGTRVILNPAPVRKLPASLLKNTSITIANETETVVLTGADDIGMHTAVNATRPLHEAGVETIIMTLGKEGALVANKSGATRIPGFRVKAVDTTSAGDTFTGAIACCLAQGRALEDSVLFANAAAALSATKTGAQISMPTREEVEEMLRTGETR
ncbi:MAG TPA: ribokinase [Abditibacteriaceae bacterium]|nr:ribokinase [Abditibacteriaceae bacterium]